MGCLTDALRRGLRVHPDSALCRPHLADGLSLLRGTQAIQLRKPGVGRLHHVMLGPSVLEAGTACSPRLLVSSQ